MKARYCQNTVLFCLFLLAGYTSAAQSYGLAFASNEVVQDKRTGVDLSPGGSFRFGKDFELEFDISIQPYKIEYFGYVVRVIENNKKNIDLIYDNTPSHFKVVVGDKLPEIFFNVPRESRYDAWHTIRMKFDLAKHLLTLTCGAQNYSQRLDVEEDSKFRIMFGENHEGSFQTTDVPPMKIRNIRIIESEKPKYFWPLDEEEGISAPENISQSNAAINNPVWVRKLHRNWQLLKTFTLQGAASSAFDQDQGIVYTVGLDSLFAFNARNGATKTVRYQSGKFNLLRGNQSLFNTGNRILQNLYLDQQLVSSFNPLAETWDHNFTLPSEITDNWHFNKFYSSMDSALYVLSGYGHFNYKNEIRRYDFVAHRWDTIQPLGDFFTPRYLAGLGAVKGGAYIMGGYGSQSGQQILNPKNLYDLLSFDTKTGKFKKLYELEIKGEDFVFANSLVVNEKERSFYGLVFPKQKYNSALQLIKGSLDTPSIRFFADKIPYRFNDIHSFSDLYFCPSIGSFLAITLFFNDNNQTEVAIYSLAAPPLENGVRAPAVAGRSVVKLVAYVLGAVLVLLVAIAVYLGRKGKVRREEEEALAASRSGVAAQPVQVFAAPAEAVPVMVSESEEIVVSHEAVLQEHTPDPPTIRNAILLFGDLQLFDSNGLDITRYFTPLLKELFLVILVYTIRKERGISSEKLKELLWYDKSVESARNNRSVNIAKLKAILDKLQYCEISKETGYWKINIDYAKVHVDYFEYLSIINDKGKLDKPKVQHLAEITQRGSFLSNVEYDWLDSFKSEISNMVIDTYLRYAATIQIADDPEFLVQIANYIFDFDSVNEEAMVIKCRALVHLGKHSLAKQCFENFNKEYKALYGEEFRKDFHDFL